MANVKHVRYLSIFWPTAAPLHSTNQGVRSLSTQLISNTDLGLAPAPTCGIKFQQLIKEGLAAKTMSKLLKFD